MRAAENIHTAITTNPTVVNPACPTTRETNPSPPEIVEIIVKRRLDFFIKNPPYAGNKNRLNISD